MCIQDIATCVRVSFTNSKIEDKFIMVQICGSLANPITPGGMYMFVLNCSKSIYLRPTIYKINNDSHNHKTQNTSTLSLFNKGKQGEGG